MEDPVDVIRGAAAAYGPDLAHPIRQVSQTCLQGLAIVLPRLVDSVPLEVTVRAERLKRKA
jgi:hypothetical protein